MDRYADGDHEPVTKRDIPGATEVAKAWTVYAQWVLEQGRDPLQNFIVKRERKIRERWAFRFSDSLVGVLCIEARCRRKVVLLSTLPDYVMEYLNAERFPNPHIIRLRDFKNREDAAAVGVSVKRWHRVTLEHTEPLPDTKVTAQLRTRARRVVRVIGK